jgi:predicted MPP superfamily phosphohydrolase
MGLLLVNTIIRYKATHFLPDLPEAFDGFTITQISDLHSGSFDNREIKYAIDLVNEQNSDDVVLLATS